MEARSRDEISRQMTRVLERLGCDSAPIVAFLLGCYDAAAADNAAAFSVACDHVARLGDGELAALEQMAASLRRYEAASAIDGGELTLSLMVALESCELLLLASMGTR